MNYYTVYDIRTDEVLAHGTSRECAEILGFSSQKCFRTMVARAQMGRSSRYAVVTLGEATQEESNPDRQVWEENVRRRWARLQKYLLGVIHSNKPEPALIRTQR